MTRGGRVTVDQRQVGLLDRLGRATSGIGCSRAHPRGVPKSLAFEFYLMRLELEHIMNRVKQKKSAAGERRVVTANPATRIDHRSGGHA